MATTLVTGATGFVGAHLARALRERGDRVRCLVRPTSNLAALEGLEVETAEGDLRDPASLAIAVRGCRRVFHCAADYRLYARDSRELYASNVDGTRHLLEASLREGVERVTYTSSVGALGLVRGGEADEETPVALDDMIGHYKRSKFLAEREVDTFVARGLPVVLVHPSTPVGELDLKPTPTGKIVLDFLNGRMPAYVDTGLNLVDVRAVARGHLLADERGQVGRSYILGDRNVTLKQMLDLLAEISGRPPVRVRLPHVVPLLVGALSTGWARLAGGHPAVALESVRMSRKKMFFSAARARRELGFESGSLEAALERAVLWFRESGAVRV